MCHNTISPTEHLASHRTTLKFIRLSALILIIKLLLFNIALYLLNLLDILNLEQIPNQVILQVASFKGFLVELATRLRIIHCWLNTLIFLVPAYVLTLPKLVGTRRWRQSLWVVLVRITRAHLIVIRYYYEWLDWLGYFRLNKVFIIVFVYSVSA